ncbi:flagellar motor switch protein FliN/FliY [Sphingobium fontiphilum]|uniref:Flagellar motor switch protein FliN n=1 Tax=Sphingobium fontiphilum TaxID=944425 RepID=A0A7W6GPI3_9SPHN|nr:flagellar motor switch protein FliN [Sphingobium fontiphilum]MBB3982443.1 flagellar motor switch protein FliN/FliY [Sphingobium fontiphilum]
MSDMSEAPRVEGKGEDSFARLANNRQFKLLADIPVRMSVEVGSTSLRLAEVMDLAEGSIVELDRQADELLDIMVNGALIAKGEVVTVNGRYGIRIVDIAAAETRLAGVERRS